MNQADANLQSWTFWDRKLFDDQGNPRVSPSVIALCVTPVLDRSGRR